MSTQSEFPPKYPRFSTQLIIWLITMAFLVGIAYASFLTKDEFNAYKDKHDDRVEKILDKIDQKFLSQENRHTEQLEKIMKKLDELAKSKQDKR